MRHALVNAIAACVGRPVQPTVRRFLLGLSRDELEFIAEFLGSCILESAEACGTGCDALLRWSEERSPGIGIAYQDRDHKMILVREFFSLGKAPALARAAGR